MNIRYRSKFTGRFIAAKQAASKKFAKAVVSELRDERNKSMGRAPGFYTHPKRLARRILPTLKTRPPARRYAVPLPELPDTDTPSDIDTEYQWQKEYADVYGELDYLDQLDDLLTDEDEWYEEA